MEPGKIPLGQQVYCAKQNAYASYRECATFGRADCARVYGVLTIYLCLGIITGFVLALLFRVARVVWWYRKDGGLG